MATFDLRVAVSVLFCAIIAQFECALKNYKIYYNNIFIDISHCLCYYY